MRRAFRSVVGAAGLLSMVLGAGCATQILDVRIPPSENPRGGQVVLIAEVTDARKFEAHPSKSSTPTCETSEGDSSEIALRVIARRRNGFGFDLGDILLPEDRTVEDLVRESVTKALQAKGYVVLYRHQGFMRHHLSHG